MGAAEQIKHRKVAGELKFVKQEGKDLVIEGFANRYKKDGAVIIDRGNDVIEPKEWKLEEYLDNPLIFFQHDRNVPIGKAVEIKVQDDGLYIKAKISQSKHPDVDNIRTLIQEGILKSFSVGIDVEDEERDKEGANLLKGVRLMEVSVVSIPMNQQSFFSISNKAWKGAYELNKYGDKLREKGAWVAGAIHNRIFELARDSDSFDRGEALAAVAESAGVSTETIYEIMAGNTVDIPEAILNAFAQNLGLDSAKLVELNGADVEVMGADIMPEAEDEPQSDEEQSVDEAGEDQATDQTEEDEPEESEEVGEEPENEMGEEQEFTEDGDGEEENAEEDQLAEEEEEDFELEDEDEKPLPEEEDEEKLKENVQTESFRDCVTNKVREEMEAGKTEEQALASALESCRKSGPEKSVLMPEEWAHIFQAISEFKASKLGKAKTAEVGTVTPSDAEPMNLALAAANQTNVLIAQMIAELQKLQNILMDQKQREEVAASVQSQEAQTPQAPAQNTPLELADEEDSGKHLDLIANYRKQLNKKLSDLGV